MSKRGRLLVALSAAVVAVLVGLNLLAYIHAYAMTHFSVGGARTPKPEELSFGEKLKVLCVGTRIPRPESQLPPSALGPECRSLKLTGTKGVMLGAWYCAADPASPLVILFHGYAGDKTGTLPEARAFLQLGLSVLLVDFRGSGESSAAYTTIGYDEAEDVASAVHYARTHLGHPKIVLYGVSMGAAAVLRAVANDQVRPDAIIAEAVFDRMLSTVKNRFEILHVPSFPGAQLLVFWGGWGAGFNAFKHNPADYARAVRCPILFLHGSADPRARVTEARQVFAQVPGSKWFHEFPGVRHEAAVKRFPQEWTETVRSFLAEVERQPN